MIKVFLVMLFISSVAVAQNTKKIKTIIVDAGHGGKDFGAHGGYEGGLNSYEKNITLDISLKLVAELRRQLPDVKIVPTRTTDIYQNPREKAEIANENKGDLFICIHADAVNLKTGRRQIGSHKETRYRVKYSGRGKRKKKISTPYTVTVPTYEYYKIGSQRSGTSIWLFAAHKTSDKLKAVMDNEELQIESGIDSVYNSINFDTPEGRIRAKIYADRYQKKSIKLATMVDEEVDKTDRAALGLNQRQVGIWVLQATNMPAILIETGFITNHDDERYLNSDKGQQELAECITRAVKKYKEDIDHTSAAVAAIQKPVENNDTVEKYAERGKNILKRIDLKQQNFKVDLYDDGDIDGDIVSVYYNGKAVLSNKKLTDKPITLNLTADNDKSENELLIYAENEGNIPPNTALMVVTEGNTRTEVRITSDAKKNGVVLFTKK
ncbi:MAG: N-acetylmuramoyl-L-alanine amidase [Ferruginibacter sp.]|nr:N-acetylmuramoyl-L-alanine amidase [Ferruginibacter sp.]